MQDRAGQGSKLKGWVRAEWLNGCVSASVCLSDCPISCVAVQTDKIAAKNSRLFMFARTVQVVVERVERADSSDSTTSSFVYLTAAVESVLF